MKIEHIAMWTRNLEELKLFYEKYFGGKANNKYYNPKKGFESYFIEFGNGSRLEIMRMQELIVGGNNVYKQVTGYAHVAFSVGSKEKVDELTNQIRHDGYRVVGEPRVTGDGYYESCILDPDGNMIEITE